MAAPSARQGPDWSCLPADVLGRIIRRASSWQIPGPCLAAPVCCTWRSAAAGCKGICLLYQQGSRSRDRCFVTWLGRRSHQLGAFTLMSDNQRDVECILTALAEAGAAALPAAGSAAVAAAAANAPGRGLPLHTLQVVGCTGPDLQLTGKLLAGLPNLHTLVLNAHNRDRGASPHSGGHVYVQEALAPLQQATQLQELYLSTSCCSNTCCQVVASLLPTSLRRLGWRTLVTPIPDLSHLTRLTFLRLQGWEESTLRSSKLPPGLQQLHMWCMSPPDTVLQEQREVLAGFENTHYIWNASRQVTTLTQLRAAGVAAYLLRDPAARATFGQLTNLSSLQVRICELASQENNRAVVTAAAGFRNLRCLHLNLRSLPPAIGLAALTGLTRLCVTISRPRAQQQQCGEWAEELGRMPALKWLSVPGQLLLVERPWLGGLQQLRVLVLSNLLDTPSGPSTRAVKRGPSVLEQVLQQLEGHRREALPPHLLLLGLTGVSVQQQSTGGLRARLRQVLGGSGCEVVACPDLQLNWDPAQQLPQLLVALQVAGLPEALQEALA